MCGHPCLHVRASVPSCADVRAFMSARPCLHVRACVPFMCARACLSCAGIRAFMCARPCLHVSCARVRAFHVRASVPSCARVRAFHVRASVPSCAGIRAFMCGHPCLSCARVRAFMCARPCLHVRASVSLSSCVQAPIFYASVRVWASAAPMRASVCLARPRALANCVTGSSLVQESVPADQLDQRSSDRVLRRLST
jgi:hypothetical protein